MKKIGIIGAFDAEIEKFIEMFSMKKDSKRKEVYIANISDNLLVVAKSGIGKVNSAAMTQYLIDTYELDFVINSGCAGSLCEDVKIMDVIVSEYVTYHDFKPLRVMEYSVPNNGKVKASDFLIKKTIEILKKDETNFQVGPICSGDCFVTSSEMRDLIRFETKACAVDMESGSIGHICSINNIPFVSIRTISDFANGEEDFEEKAAHKSSLIVKKIIDTLL